MTTRRSEDLASPFSRETTAEANVGRRPLIAEAMATMRAGGDRSKTSRDVLKSSSIETAAKLKRKRRRQ